MSPDLNLDTTEYTTDATVAGSTVTTVRNHHKKPERHLTYGKDFKYHVDFVQHAKIQADLKRKERNKKRQICAVLGGYLRHDVILQLVDLR